MPKYLVERRFATDFDLTADATGVAACRAIVERNRDHEVTWVHSYVAADKHTWYCVYEAPGPEAIRKTAARNGLPVDRITEISVLDPYFFH